MQIHKKNKQKFRQETSKWGENISTHPAVMKIFLILFILLTKKATTTYGERLKPFQDVGGTVCIVTFTSCLSLCLELPADDDVDVVVVGGGHDVYFATTG